MWKKWQIALLTLLTLFPSFVSSAPFPPSHIHASNQKTLYLPVMPKVNLQWCHPQIVLSITCLDTGTWMRAFASRTNNWSRSGKAKVFFQGFSKGTLIQHRTIKNIAWILNRSYRLIRAWTTSHHYICNAHAGWHVQGEDQLQQGSCGEGQVKTTQPQSLCSLCQHMFLIRKIVQQLNPEFQSFHLYGRFTWWHAHACKLATSIQSICTRFELEMGNIPRKWWLSRFVGICISWSWETQAVVDGERASFSLGGIISLSNGGQNLADVVAVALQTLRR